MPQLPINSNQLDHSRSCHSTTIRTTLFKRQHSLKTKPPLVVYSVLSLTGGFSISLISFRLQLHMADSEHSSSGSTYLDSREETIEESKLKFSKDEETLIIRMYNLVGERWALIAGRIPGRTAEEIEEYWNTRCSTSERCFRKPGRYFPLPNISYLESTDANYGQHTMLGSCCGHFKRVKMLKDSN
ncbi:hypothetical protein CRYUN_Cryun31cG0018100 [Craigia yunnanensis]